MNKFLLGLLMVGVVQYNFGQSKNGGKLSAVTVVDRPIIEWANFPQDTINLVGLNIQKVSAVVKSRLPLSRIEFKVNGVITDVYDRKDFSPSKGQNKFEEFIERTLTLRTGINTIELTVTNIQNTYSTSSRKLKVDPNQITLLRSEKDVNAPMIYVSAPSNIRDDMVVLYQEILRLAGTVIDESGVQTLKVNGITVPVRENGAFVINLPLNIGDNPVTIEARDINQNISLRKFIITRKNMGGTEYSSKESKNYLLLIGIDKYQNWPVLNNAVSDIDSVRKILTSLYRFEPENTTVITNEHATLGNIYKVLRSYIERITPNDNLLIYYSGHGYFDKLLNEGYWVPVEAARTVDVSAMVPNAQILKVIENINSQHTLLVADACFSGSLFSSNTRSYADHVEKYKSRWGLASGRLEVVSDGVIGRNSPFAESLISFLRNNKEDRVATSDLVQFVKKRVTEANQQTPIGSPLKGVGDEGGEFVFYKRN